jgi:hypothetical protein
MLRFSFMGRMGMENSESTVPKRRSQADKVGKHKYEIQRMNRIDARLDRIEKLQRIIVQGLSYYFKFERPVVETICCKSDMDRAVVSAIFESGSGILPKQIAPKFPQYKLEKHKILRIVRRVNKNCEDAYGKTLIEKHGKKWVFTDFGFEVWGKTRDEVETDG